MTLTDCTVKKIEDQSFQVIATFADGTIKTWSDFATWTEADDCRVRVEERYA